MGCKNTKPIDAIDDGGRDLGFAQAEQAQSLDASMLDRMHDAPEHYIALRQDLPFVLDNLEIVRKAKPKEHVCHKAQSTGKRPKGQKHYQGDLFSDGLVLETDDVGKPTTMDSQGKVPKTQSAEESVARLKILAAAKQIDKPEIAGTRTCGEMSRCDANKVESPYASSPISSFYNTSEPQSEKRAQTRAQSPALQSKNAEFDDQIPIKHGYFNVHQNTDAVETLQSFEFEMYQFLLDPEKGDLLTFADADRSEPLIRQIGTRDMAALIFARRKLTDSKLRVRLDAAELDGKFEITQARELANIRKFIKTSRKGLAAKYFVAMAKSKAYTHDAIVYSVYLPIEVLRRQRKHGWLYWRKGGNSSRILVDRKYAFEQPHSSVGF